jgi:NOL1/NOP2/fmu family ribosome biogenesis protein
LRILKASVATNWAVKQVLSSVRFADGGIGIAANDRNGVRWALSHNFV